MKVKDLLKLIYPNQPIRIASNTSCLDTDVCLKQADRIRSFLNYKVDRISVTNNGVLRIDVQDE